jgi:hypothetical protein
MAWTPADLGLDHDWWADDPDLAGVSDGGTFATVPDRGSGGDDLTGAAGACQMGRNAINGQSVFIPKFGAGVAAQFAASIAQPHDVFIVGRTVSFSYIGPLDILQDPAAGTGHRIGWVDDGGGGHIGRWRANCGTLSEAPQDGRLIEELPLVIHMRVNGASSEVRVNGAYYWTGDFGSGDCDGLTLFTDKFQYARILSRSTLLSATELAQLLGYLNTVYDKPDWATIARSYALVVPATPIADGDPESFLRFALEERGHSVAYVASADVATEDFTPYDAILYAGAYADRAANGPVLLARRNAGQHIWASLRESGMGATAADTIAVQLGLVSIARLGGSFAWGNLTTVTAHDITDFLGAPPVTFSSKIDAGAYGYIDAGDSAAGTLLATLSGREVLYAAAAGEVDLSSVTLAANLVASGIDYTDGQYFWTDDGRQLFINEVEWLGGSLIAAPGFSVGAVTDEGATLFVVPDTAYGQIQFQVTDAADPSFAAPLLDVTDSSAARFGYIWTGGTPSTQYIARARGYTTGWSEWATTIAFTTLALDDTIYYRGPGAFFTAPINGAAVTLPVLLQWKSGLTGNATLRYSTDLGANWNLLQAVVPPSQTSYLFTTAVAVGTIVVWWLHSPDDGLDAYVEATITDGSSIIHFRGDVCSAQHDEYWATGNPWYCATFCRGRGGRSTDALETFDIGVLAPQALPDAIEAWGTVTFRLASLNFMGQAPFWATHAGLEGWRVGVAFNVDGSDGSGDSRGVWVGLDSFSFLPSVHYTCDGDLPIIGYLPAGYSIADFNGSSTLSRLNIAFKGVNASFVSGVYSAVHPHIYGRIIDERSFRRFPCPCYQPRAGELISVTAKMSRPDPIGQPDRVRIQAKFGIGAVFANPVIPLPAPYPAPYNGWDLDAIYDAPGLGCGRVGFGVGKNFFPFFGVYGAAEIFSFEAFVSAAGSACAGPGAPLTPTVPLNVTIVCDEPTLEALTADPDHASTRWEVTSASDPYYTAPVVDTGFLTTAKDTYAVGPLPPGDYIWRATFRDVFGVDDGPYDGPAFTIDPNLPPGPPTIVSPVDGAVVSGASFVLRFTAATDPESDPLEYEADISYDGGDTWLPLFALGTIDPDTNYTVSLAGIGASRSAAVRVRAWDGCLYGPYATVCITVSGVGCPAEIINITTVRRVELWSDCLGAGGQRILFIPDWISVQDHRDNTGELTVEVLLPRVSRLNALVGVWPELRPRRVLRLIYQDFTWEEFRIARQTDAAAEDGGESVRLLCETICYDLNDRIIRITERSGRVRLDDGSYGLWPSEQLAKVLQWAPAYFAIGTVTDNVRIDLDFNWSTVQEAVLKIADAAELKYRCRRACDGLYIIDLTEPGAAVSSSVVSSIVS